MAMSAASGSSLFKFLRPGFRPQSTDVQAAVFWGVAAGTTALWIVQNFGLTLFLLLIFFTHAQSHTHGKSLYGGVQDSPFDWLRKTFFERPDPEQN
ncbi:hypothetical protein OROGR_011152 [Orobanche gracilis]